jgi:hypothetical protein
MSLDIIGPGFGRTGTYSLKIALEHLGFGPAHHMFEVRDNPRLLPDWEAIARGEARDWDTVFAGYRSQVDWPGARVWSELATRYPAAKVILTVRDPEEWHDSIQQTILPFMAGRGHHNGDHPNAVAEMAFRLVVEGVFDGRLDDRRHAISIFNAHNDEVRETIDPARLLVFDVRQGWEPLCAFLGVPVPSVSFPRLNASRHFAENEWAGGRN